MNLSKYKQSVYNLFRHGLNISCVKYQKTLKVFLYVRTSDEHTSCVSSEMAVGEMCNNSFSTVFIGLAFGRVTMTHVPSHSRGDANAEARPVANMRAGMSGDQRAAHAYKPKSFWNDGGGGPHLDSF